MKIASYNIFAGGFASYADTNKYPKRLSKIAEAVKTINADIIGLIETYKWDGLFNNEELVDLFGYEKVYSQPLGDPLLHERYGYDTGITVLSRIPETRFESVRIHNRTIVKTVIPYHSGELDIYITYLDNLQETVRMKQVQSLLKQMDKSNPIVIMGDLNTFSGYDIPTHIAAGVNLLTQTLGVKDLPIESINKLRKSGVSDYLVSNGFTDANTQNVPTAPTDMVDKKILPPFLNLDRVFYNGKIYISNFTVVKGKLFEETSDHYPVYYLIDQPHHSGSYYR